jgi:hypothetical protein
MSGFSRALKQRQLDSKLAHSSLRRRPSLRAIEAAAVDLKIAQEAPITIRALQFFIK